MADVLCLDPIGGIAGDMFLAMCLDLGVPRDELERQLAVLALPGWKLVVTRASRHEIVGTHVDVEIEPPLPTASGGTRGPGERGEHAHDHPHSHPHPHGHSHGHAEGHRPWRAIRDLIIASALPEPVKQRALEIFTRLARAEAAVHGTTEEDVEFHEVGAIDSIVDVVGAAICVELLGAPKIYAAPPPLGSGLGRSAHGPMPIPPPATLEVLRGRAVRFEGKGELTTPTGAAIASALAEQGAFPEMVLERVGYGVGTKEMPDRPNVLRGLLGTRAHGAESGTWLVEATLDDATPQVLAFALDRLMAEGALDVWIAPVTMKKGRPGHRLSLLAPGPARARLTQALLEETPTLGVRAWPVERTALERRFEAVQTPYGEVRVKIGRLGERDLNAAPEYEDCARLARERNVPLKDVIAAALAALGARR